MNYSLIDYLCLSFSNVEGDTQRTLHVCRDKMTQPRSGPERADDDKGVYV
jgi:hypothetical protein